MARDAIDVWCEQQPDVSDRHALRRWLDAMPEVRSYTPPPADDALVYKTCEQPPPTAAPEMDLDVARSEALLLVEGLADEVGSEVSKLAQRNSELEQRVRELEVQLGFEQRLRELEPRCEPRPRRRAFDTAARTRRCSLTFSPPGTARR